MEAPGNELLFVGKNWPVGEMTCGRTDPQARWLVGEPTCERLVGEINLKATWLLGSLTRKRDDLLQKMTCWRNNKWARVPNQTGTYFGFCAMGGVCILILCTCSAGKCNSCFSLLLLGSRITFVTLNWYGFAKLEIFFVMWSLIVPN